MSHMCPVCGYPDLTEPPRRPRGGGSYEICPSCKYQFGYDDDALHISDEQWRQKWIEGGMKWFSKGRKPPSNWDPHKQLLNIGVHVKEGS